MSTVKVAPVPQIAPDASPIERMWIGKVSAGAFAVGVPIPMELGAAAGIFPGGQFVALRVLGKCLVICPVDSVAPGDLQKEADLTFVDAVESWIRRGNLQNTVLGRAVLQRPKK